MVGRRVVGCNGCFSRNPDACNRKDKFVPVFNKEQLAAQFRKDLHDPQVLLRDYRDIFVFLWIIGHFDDEHVDEQIISKVETYAEVEPEHQVNNDIVHSDASSDAGEHLPEPGDRAAESSHSASVAGQSRPSDV
jgi:hypothetical protein